MFYNHYDQSKQMSITKSESKSKFKSNSSQIKSIISSKDTYNMTE